MSTLDPLAGSHYQVEGATFFALIGSQRSGTNFFRELLNTNDRTVVWGEILLPYPIPITWHNYLRTMVSRAQPPVYTSDAVTLVDEYLVFARDDVHRGCPGKAANLKAIGFDIKYNQLRFISPVIRDLLEPPFLLEYMRLRRIPIVHVFRRNPLHQALSLAIAEARNVYHNYGGKASTDMVTIEPQKILNHCHWVRNEQAEFRRLATGIPMLDVAYEDLAAECQKADANGKLRTESPMMDQIARFLGVYNDFSRPKSLTKVIDRPYSQILSNHAALLTRLKTSPFADLASTI